MKKYLFLACGLAALCGTASSASAAFISQSSNITSNTRWTRDNVYILTRVIFVTPGVTLTIEPGTIIRGVKAGTTGSDIAAEPGALVVARDAKLVANGTPDDPIFMTSIDDPHVIGGAATIPESYTNSVGATKFVVRQDYSPGGPGDPDTTGPLTGTNGFAYTQQWGGLVVLGNAYVANYNTGTPPTEDGDGNGLPDNPHALVDPTDFNTGGYGRDYIEGLNPQTIPSAANLGIYGNKDDNDNSGVYRFISVRYGGFKIGANNEINAITCGGMGRGTVMEFSEAVLNVDDGFEFFGGTIDTRHLYANYILDDSFDVDEGFRGTHQFWSIVQGNTATARSGYGNDTPPGTSFTDTQFDNYFEMDGAENNNNSALPYTTVNVYNLTLVGSGTTSSEFTFTNDARVSLRNAAATNTADLASLSQTALDPIGTTGDVFNFHYYFDGDTATTENRDFVDLVAPTTTSAIEGTSFVIGNGTARPGVFTKNGLELRLPAGSAARVEDGPMPPPGLVQVNYAGYQRDNLFLSGWSLLHYLEVLPATNVQRPAVAISGTSNPVVSFSSAGAGVKYVIEKSTDRRTWTPVNQGNTLTGAGTINFTDTSTTLTVGTPVFYRAYAL